MVDRPANRETAARLAREAAALRANLAKRKAQTRERANAPQAEQRPSVRRAPAPEKA